MIQALGKSIWILKGSVWNITESSPPSLQAILYSLLLENAENELSGKTKEEFIEATVKMFNDNMIRINEELAWFINKFDYKYKDEPWKNSKDSVPRAITKLNSIIIEEESK